MWKWIGGGCLLIIAIVGVLGYAGFRKLSDIADAGPAVTVMIGAPPERVFASLANADSQSTWRLGSSTSRTNRKGMFLVGDTIFDIPRDTQPSMAWVIDTIVTNHLIAARAINLRTGEVAYRRRDSLAVVGDSTGVTSTASMLLPDSLKAIEGRATKASGGAFDFAMKVGSAAMRLEAEAELKALKRRIEGVPRARPDSGK